MRIPIEASLVLAAIVLSGRLIATSKAVTIEPGIIVVGAAPIPAPEITAPPQPVFDVRNHGAKGDGATYDTIAIQKAIDACAGTGGSVFLSKGKFLTAALELKGKVTFYVAEDAILLGGLEPEDYPELVPYTTEESVGVIWNRRSLLYANQADGLRLDGGGVIDGRGKQVIIDGIRGHMARNASNRPSILRIFQSKNVIVRNLDVHNPRMWTLVFERCRDLLIDHVNVSAPAYYQNLDGIDVSDCGKVVIRNCVIESEDDSICLKSHSLGGMKDVLIKPLLRSGHRLFQRPSPQEQFPSNNKRGCFAHFIGFPWTSADGFRRSLWCFAFFIRAA